MDPDNVPITYTSGEQVEVYRFNWLITLGVPATALFLQAWLPQQFPAFAMLDLPLLVTIFFAISRRNPISGLLTGGAIGVFQDALLICQSASTASQKRSWVMPHHHWE